MLDSGSAPKMGTVDEFLLDLDEGVFGALYRVAIGFLTLPAMWLLLGSDGSDWTLVPFLLAILILLRVGPAVLRKLLPFSAELREAWSVRRRIAKLYDSYQWRKLLWIGAGLALYVVVSGHYLPVSIALALFCLVTGAAATVRWRAVAADSRYPKPVARKTKPQTRKASAGNGTSGGARVEPSGVTRSIG
jgi:hypothetical protein